jgi:hypothetical protein
MKSVDVSGCLASDQDGIAARDLLESQLPLLAGCLHGNGNVLDLDFDGDLPSHP